MRKSRFIEAQMRLITFDVPTRQQQKTIKSGDISQSLQERIEVLTILEPSSYTKDSPLSAAQLAKTPIRPAQRP